MKWTTLQFSIDEICKTMYVWITFKVYKLSNIHIIGGSEIILASNHIKYLQTIYQQPYPQRQASPFSQFCKKFNGISIGNEILKCNKRSVA